jgi:prepilin-type N-terminal cleavage/methylation domain-containing protein/prepilin-type processing-associated H-X9-DG protein
MQKKHEFGKMVSADKRQRRGFTLIELLVVIAIIAILAAILFPVFARARENARRASCQSNLKQIGLGIMQYTQDYDERYPGMSYVVGSLGWGGSIMPYVKSIQLFQCPSEPTAQGNFNSNTAIDYFYNRALTDWAGDGDMGYSQSALQNVALTIMSGDFKTTNNWEQLPKNVSASEDGMQCSGILGNTGTGHCSDAAALDRTAAQRHLEGANYLFADGHVKFHKPTQIFGAATLFSTSGGSPTFRAR